MTQGQVTKHRSTHDIAAGVRAAVLGHLPQVDVDVAELLLGFDRELERDVLRFEQRVDEAGVDLHRVVEDVLRLFAGRMRLGFRVDYGLPDRPYLADADRGTVQLILTLLLTAALRNESIDVSECVSVWLDENGHEVLLCLAAPPIDARSFGLAKLLAGRTGARLDRTALETREIICLYLPEWAPADQPFDDAVHDLRVSLTTRDEHLRNVVRTFCSGMRLVEGQAEEAGEAGRVDVRLADAAVMGHDDALTGSGPLLLLGSPTGRWHSASARWLPRPFNRGELLGAIQSLHAEASRDS